MENVYLHRTKNKGDGLRGFARVGSFHFQYQIIWQKRNPTDFMWHLSLGDRGSETPVDFAFRLLGLSIFLGWQWPGLGAFCEKIGRGHKRELSLRAHNGALWWNLWYNDDNGMDSWHKCDKHAQPKLYPWRWGRKKYRSWMCLREGNIDLNPVKAFFGPRFYRYGDVSSFAGETVRIGQFSGDSYLVEFTLQRVYRQRDHGFGWFKRRTFDGWVVDWDCKDGIPVQNHDWKGDCIYASGVSHAEWQAKHGAKDTHIPEGWLGRAKDLLVDDVISDRRRYGYRPPHNHADDLLTMGCPRCEEQAKLIEELDRMRNE